MSVSAVPGPPRARFGIAGLPGRMAPRPQVTRGRADRRGRPPRRRDGTVMKGITPPGRQGARAARRAAGAAGVAGSVACAASMVLAAAGVGASATAAGMVGMSSHGGTHPGLLGALIRIGPGLLIASIVLVAGAFALRHPPAAVPAVVAGAVLYAGMYAQANLAVMYASIAVGYAAWTGLFLWLRARRPAPLPARPLPAGEQPRPGVKRTP